LLVFLRRVGGGYIFIHRLLLEHFAAMWEQNKGKGAKIAVMSGSAVTLFATRKPSPVRHLKNGPDRVKTLVLMGAALMKQSTS
jgi:hypothetical protein